MPLPAMMALRVVISRVSRNYRKVVPALLDVLHLCCNNDVHRLVMRALELLERYRDSTLTTFPRDEDVPLDGVVRDDWRDLVEDEKHPGRAVLPQSGRGRTAGFRAAA